MPEWAWQSNSPCLQSQDWQVAITSLNGVLSSMSAELTTPSYHYASLYPRSFSHPICIAARMEVKELSQGHMTTMYGWCIDVCVHGKSVSGARKHL